MKNGFLKKKDLKKGRIERLNTMVSEIMKEFKELNSKKVKKLEKAVMSIAGLGSVGSIITEMLAREGFDLRLVDKGRIEEEEMHRSLLYKEEDITKFKAKQAKKRINETIPGAKVKAFHEKIKENNIFLLKGDIVFDATNNSEMNQEILEHCNSNNHDLITVRYKEEKAKVLVKTKKLDYEDIEKKMDLGEEKPSLSITTHYTAITAIREALKTVTGRNPSKIVSLNSWKMSKRTNKL